MYSKISVLITVVKMEKEFKAIYFTSLISCHRVV